MDIARPAIRSEKNDALESGIRLIGSILEMLPNPRVSVALDLIEQEAGHPLAWVAVRDRMQDALMARQ